jgi:hypothetical protein
METNGKMETVKKQRMRQYSWWNWNYVYMYTMSDLINYLGVKHLKRRRKWWLFE